MPALLSCQIEIIKVFTSYLYHQDIVSLALGSTCLHDASKKLLYATLMCNAEEGRSSSELQPSGQPTSLRRSNFHDNERLTEIILGDIMEPLIDLKDKIDEVKVSQRNQRVVRKTSEEIARS